MIIVGSSSEGERTQKKRRRASGDGGGEHLCDNAKAACAVDDQRHDHQLDGDRPYRENKINHRQIADTGNLPTVSTRRHDDTATARRCPLLELPAEIREQIWMHAVTEWTVASSERRQLTSTRSVRVLQKRAIRMDRFNRPPPPALTRVSHQLRAEALHLYYQLNVFECWRPLFWLKDWSQSTFIDWLVSLGPEQTKWLRQVVLLYKHESELEHDVDNALMEHGFELNPGLISNKQELSEYEMCFEELGLPRHFGRRRRWDRWMAASAS